MPFSNMSKRKENYYLREIEKVAEKSAVKHIFIHGNLADKELVESTFQTYKPSVVVNLAAQAGVRYSIDHPDVYIESNIIGFFNILEACRHSYDGEETGVEHLVYDLAEFVVPEKYSPKQAFIRRQIVKHQVKASNHIMTVSQYSKDDICSRFHIKPESITVVYNSVEAPDVKYFQKPEKYFLYVSEIERAKNLATLIKAYSILPDEIKAEYKLYVVGKKGNDYDNVISLINKNQIKDRVQFFGFVSDEELEKLYAHAYCFIFPSVFEGFGLPVLEAMAKATNAWSPKVDNGIQDTSESMLAELKYGDESEWKKHFDFLLPYFKDSRYIKINNRPVFSLFNYNNKEVMKKMCEYWNKLAKKNGFDGMFFLGRLNPYDSLGCFDALFTYEPMFSAWQNKNIANRVVNKLKEQFGKKVELTVYDYDEVWGDIIKNATKRTEQNILFGGFVSYDDSPRRGKTGRIVKGESPEKFEKYLNRLIQICKEQGKEYIFITAWNEWGEGAYLEPDTVEGYKYLEAVAQANAFRRN